MRYKRLIILTVCLLFCGFAFLYVHKERTLIAYEKVEDQSFRFSAEVTRIQRIGRDDYCFNISIVNLEENIAILYYAPPPYSLTLTSVDTGEKISFFSHPAIEERTILSSTQIYSGKVQLSDFSNISVPPGTYEVNVSCSFDFLETDEDPYASLDALKELDKQERRRFANSISFSCLISP